ncbi:hypothetical protein [Teichococcus aestuarii]|uniref:Uncharacterized protein n=1 Tax=Teichococcus aestuarii TaxID=568898 RepID=A0A2U1UYW6_9PROT|nr:hypothetical protein [Pseudoroseomonas aestuarii]PWC26849.1 hypothetical protein CR165_21020 [Pseudoroseomonas aestuarii]
MSFKWMPFFAMGFALSIGFGANSTLARESDSPTGDPLAQYMEVTRGRMGAGPLIEQLGSPLTHSMTVSERQLPALEESIALANNAPSSDAFGRTYDGHPLTRHIAQSEGHRSHLQAQGVGHANPGG